MSLEHPYPDYAYLELDAETNEKRWFSSKGMGVCYMHEDRVAEEISKAVEAEREACRDAVRAIHQYGEYGDAGRYIINIACEAIDARSKIT